MLYRELLFVVGRNQGLILSFLPNLLNARCDSADDFGINSRAELYASSPITVKDEVKDFGVFGMNLLTNRVRCTTHMRKWGRKSSSATILVLLGRRVLSRHVSSAVRVAFAPKRDDRPTSTRKIT